MTKLLKILVVVLLLLGVAALVLGTMLFKKREILVGRTNKMETAIMALGTTIEAEAPKAEDKPAFPEKDISEVTAQAVDTPKTSELWEKYAYDLEAQNDAPLLDLKKKEQELRSYYKTDPVTGGYERDGQGNLVTTGEGTMQGVLDLVLGKSEEQLNRLQATRQQLGGIRKEFVSTIEEYNQLKQQQRQTLGQVDGLQGQVTQLKSEIEPLKQNIAGLQEEKRSLQDTIAEQQREVARLEEENADKQAKLDSANERLAETAAKSSSVSPAPTSTGGDVTMLQVNVNPGQKGTVVAVNTEWNFVVLELSEAFVNELLPGDATSFPQLELMLKRPAPADQFVTKIKLIQIKKDENLGVFDILTDWQQVPVQEGDVAFF